MVLSTSGTADVSKRDVFADLLEDSRGLRREQAGARETWFAELPWRRKEHTLFELEMLLKGIACFGNPRNHPGPPRSQAAVAHDFHKELHIVRDALEECVRLVRELLGDKDRAYTFSRYLETLLLDDTDRTRLVSDQLTQDKPEESLFLYRNAFSGYLEICDGLLRLGRVSHRQYHALLNTIIREVARNQHFSPLVALEFRPEFDRIRNPRVLEALESVESEVAHRVVALTFLTLFRAMRYVGLIEQYAANLATTQRSHIILAVLRSDLRALVRYLDRHAAREMSAGLERELLSLEATEVVEHFDALYASSQSLVSLRNTLENIAALLHVEIRLPFERDLPPPDLEVSVEDLGPEIVMAAANVRASLHHAIHLLCSELQPDAQLPDLASDRHTRRLASERLRRDVWMFSRILRAFLAKAGDTDHETDRWAVQSNFNFVREFLAHFRAIGYQLVRASDYERLDPFMRTLESLRDVDMVDPDRMRNAIDECSRFHQYLEGLFEKICEREELRNSEFDKKDAAEALRSYLEAAKRIQASK